MVANMEQWELSWWRRIFTWGFRDFLLGCDGVFFGAIGPASDAVFTWAPPISFVRCVIDKFIIIIIVVPGTSKVHGEKPTIFGMYLVSHIYSSTYTTHILEQCHQLTDDFFI